MTQTPTHTTPAWRRARWSAAVLVGLVALGATLAPKPQPCGGLEPAYKPILAFEFARSVADLQALFGATPGPCRQSITAALDRMNLLDSVLFIPVYGAFLVLALQAIGGTSSPWTRRAVALALMACAADYAENACLFAIAPTPDVASSALRWLAWTTGAKWLLLAVVGVLGGVLVSAQRPRLRWLVLATCIAGAAVVVATLVNPARFGRWASAGVAVSWLVLLAAVTGGGLTAPPHGRARWPDGR